MVTMVLVLLTSLLFVNKVVNSASDTSFFFPEFYPDQPTLIHQGAARVSDLFRTQLQLNKIGRGSVGRALYGGPVQIWDSRTGKVASFTTSFSFIMFNPVNVTTADGLAFFLAPVNTQLPNEEGGGLLGLFPDQGTDPSNQIVAVEFDTYKNSWDPEGDRHIGIDVNGIRSVASTPWDFHNAIIANVDITYEASTGVLTANLFWPVFQKSYTVSSVVDIKNILPEFVRVGFSGATGSYGFEAHNIISWSFESRFPAYVSDDSAFIV